MSQMCWKNYFAQPITKEAFQDQQFKWRPVWFHIFNAPITGERERCHECFGRK